MDPASKVVVSSLEVLWIKYLTYWSAVLCLTLQVIKIGTSSLLRSDLSSINLSSLARVCETVKELRNMGESSNIFLWLHRDTTLSQSCPAGHKVVLVSSGAVGVGCQKMGLKTRPTALAQRQAVAAIGQIHLMRYYQEFFQALGLVSFCRSNLPVDQSTLA